MSREPLSGRESPQSGGESTPRPAGYGHLARAVLYREAVLFLRYPANAVGGVIVALLAFGLLFYGGRMIAGRALTDSI